MNIDILLPLVINYYIKHVLVSFIKTYHVYSVMGFFKLKNISLSCLSNSNRKCILIG